MSNKLFSNDRGTVLTLREGALRGAKRKQTLSLVEMLPKAANDQRGSDPYNTSGTFDRKKNWARVGKR
jgi:hypothetical protein